MRRARTLLAAVTAFAAAVSATLLAAVPASAHPKTFVPIANLPAPTATLTQVANFGPNPTGLEMYLYVPERVRPRPAVVLAIHYCTGSGPDMFRATQFASLADRYGFIVMYPSAPREGHCYDVSSPGALRHDGDSDPVGLVSMVRYVLRHRHANPNQVFVTGLSSGAMMTNVLLGAYPDVFQAGSAMSGVPFGCFATTDGSMWNSACAQGQISKSPQEWGDLVRNAFPGYRGPRPRMQLWHGTADTVLAYPNFGEAVKQWTNVLHTRKSVTDHPRPSWTHSAYSRGWGQVEVDAYSIEGQPHDLGFNVPEWAQYAVHFFGLSGR
ncbi:extracellular catalytic domain type 1 short-chain-length polyhydroxyalkanoate depolymerase [Rhizomonospora bruguierae]|uniref:extracellular catalytic domain type 1 short-chain-length polyhydroxyalkanoate depolymerase n=1 Tax=Rhizomonospora bruguierae TaxID=1581705 RepID=UPI001BCC3D6E|nr:PHB depolymerase family esterase [Micromonospora sp. NBRC 107566]